MAAVHRGGVDLAGWLANEASATVKHELVDGELFAMTGGTLRHNRLAIAVLRRVSAAAQARGCRSYMSGARLWTGAAGYYPDVMVVCEPPADDQFETSPCFVLEVLSPSTAGIDRREKRAAYRAIPAMRTYALLDADRVRVDVYERIGVASTPEEAWIQRVLSEGDTLHVTCLNLEVPIDEVYAEAQ